MLIQSHLVLAYKLLAKTRGQWPGINPLTFLWGNIRPDFHSPLNRGTHKYDVSMKMIEKRWRRLGKNSLFFGAVSSYQLGCILHYVADFFTYAHNGNEFDDNLKEHFAYEKELHGKMMDIETISSLDFVIDDFQAYINELREDYLSQAPSPQRDCEFISSCTWALTRWAMTPAYAKNPVFA